MELLVCACAVLWFCFPTLALALFALVFIAGFTAFIFSAFGWVGGALAIGLIVGVGIYDTKTSPARSKAI